MRRTRLGWLLLTAGWSSFPLALVFQTLAPALLGVVLLAFVASARLPTPSLLARRTIAPGSCQHEPITVTTHVEASPPLPILAKDCVPPGADLLAQAGSSGHGTARHELVLRATRPGLMVFGEARVIFRDPHGLLEDEMGVPMRDVIEVRPDPSRLRTAERVARDLARGGRRRARLAADTEPEFERIRDWREGDRLRDIDWP
ncbi:MAG: hypothetical protein ACLGIK_13920, partial [Gemmatimonadota bacterium]